MRNWKEILREEWHNTKKFGKELLSWKRVFYFFFPWLLYAVLILLYYIVFPYNIFIRLTVITFLYLIPPAGKESMVPAGIYLLRDYYGIWSIPITALSITFVDFFVGLWMMWNWDLVKLIPFFGTYVRKLEKIGAEKWRKHRYLSQLAYVGLALFVAFPFQGSGGVGATVIGRILGMNKYKVLYSIVAGALFGTFLIGSLAYFAIFSFENIPKSVFTVMGIIIFVIVFIVAYKWIKKGGKK